MDDQKIQTVSSKENLLQVIKENIQILCKQKSLDIKLILPNGIFCLEVKKKILQKNIVSKFSVEVVSIDQLKSHSNIYVLDDMKEKILLSNIILSFKELNYTLLQAISLSAELANLFFVLETNKIQIEKIQNIEQLELAKHWELTTKFLIFAYKKREEYLKLYSLLSKAQYQELLLTQEINDLKNSKKNFSILVSIINNSVIFYEFIKNFLSIDNTKIILPIIPDYITQESTEFVNSQEKSPFFVIYEMLKNTLDDKMLCLFPAQKKTTSINNRINTVFKGMTEKNPYRINISYKEFDSPFLEANYVTLKSKHLLDQNVDLNLAIIVKNPNIKILYTRLLQELNIKYSDMIGNELINYNAVSFILILAEVIYDEFSLSALFSLLNHPFLISKNSSKLLHILTQDEFRFCRSLSEITSSIKILDECREEFLSWFKNIISIIDNTEYRKHNLKQKLLNLIRIAQILSPGIWEHNIGVLNYLKEITLSIEDFVIHNNYKTAQVFYFILKNKRDYNFNTRASVMFCKPEEAALINFDVIFLVDFNEATYSSSQEKNPWIHNKLQKALNLNFWQNKLGKEIYYTCLNLDNEQVIITRAKRNLLGQESKEAFLLKKIKYFFPNSENQEAQAPIIEDVRLANVATSFNTNIKTLKQFPNKISATDIFILMNAPYNFYAKKILNLKKKDFHFENEIAPNIFGNIVHKIFSIYSSSTMACAKNVSKDQEQYISSIACNLLASESLSDNLKREIYIKLTPITKDYITYHNSRQKNINYLFSERKGSFFLTIEDKPIEIVAIADRIEVDMHGRATIMDYKTGAIASKKNVYSGLVPQLVIEAMILYEGGFNIDFKDIKSLIYVKINTSSPHIEEQELKITEEEIKKHRAALKRVLTYYVTEGKFFIKPNLMEYDDYLYLSRRESLR